MAMWRLYTGEPREPRMREMVDSISSKLAAEQAEPTGRTDTGADSVTSAMHGATPLQSGEWPRGNRRPFVSHGNWAGGGYSAGRTIRPHESLRDEDFRVLPVDSYDRSAYWHDFGYDQGWRNLRQALAEGYSNADALINFHYHAAEADRRLAEEGGAAEASTPGGALMRWRTTRLARDWARDRETIAHRLLTDHRYRAHVNALPIEHLADHVSPTWTAKEVQRFVAEEAWEDRMARYRNSFTSPWGVP